MSGTKFDQEKVDLHVLDPLFIEGTARVAQFGESKYGRSNWMQGITQSRIINAMRRHLAQIEKGEDIDEESGYHHGYHIAWGCQVLAYQHRNDQTELDDRRWGASLRYDNFRNGASKGISGHTVPMLSTDPEAGLHAEPSEEIRLDMSNVQPKTAEGAQEEIKPGNGDQIKELQRVISDWADSVYPDRTVENALTKMMLHEIPELLHGNAMDPMEFADVAILLFDVAHLQGIDIVQAMRYKMEVNEKRTWEIDPATGLMSHVKNEFHVDHSNKPNCRTVAKPVPTGFLTDSRKSLSTGLMSYQSFGDSQRPVPKTTTEKGAEPPTYPWEPNIPEWAVKAKISSQIKLKIPPLGYGCSNAEIRIGRGQNLILIHKCEKDRSKFEKFHCAVVKDVESEAEFQVSWSEIEPWNA